MQNKTCAVVYCAGLGERMRPLTHVTPKPLLKVYKGLSLLELNIRKLLQTKITNIYINYSYGKEQFEAVISKYDKSANIKLIYEPIPLGQGGTLIVNKQIFSNYDFLFGVNGDTFVNEPLLNAMDIRGKNQLLGTPSLHPRGLIIDFNNELKGLVFINSSFYYTAEPLDKKYFNYCGIAYLETKALFDLSFNVEEFTGFFGEGDLFDLLVKQGISVKLRELNASKFYTADTVDELNILKMRLESILL